MQCIVIEQSFLRLLKLHKLAVGKLDLLRGGLTRCHSVLDHGLNLRQNIPFKVQSVTRVKQKPAAHSSVHRGQGKYSEIQ